MSDDLFLPGPDDTQSFSVSEAVRAPVGVRLAPGDLAQVRRAALLLLMGLVLLFVDFRTGQGDLAAGGWDIIPDTAGGFLILLATLAVAKVAKLVGPARAGSRVILLGVLHLALVVPNDLPVGMLDLTPWTEAVTTALQSVVGLLGTALTATVLARAHDAADQLGRRDRWARTRRWSLGLAVVWLPLAMIAKAAGEGEKTPLAFVAGVTGILTLVVGVVVLFHLARALAASYNVGLAVGHGEA